jgi:DNA-binding XRE family transcriptional regulator
MAAVAVADAPTRVDYHVTSITSIFPGNLVRGLCDSCRPVIIALNERGAMRFGELLRQLRKDAGLTQEDLAKRAGIPLPSLRGHEQGQRSPSWASVVKLARGLGVSTGRFDECDEVRSEPTPKRPRGWKERAG